MTSPERPKKRPSFQLQIVPGDPRRPTRQFQLSRRGARLFAAALCVLLAPVVAGLVLMPWLLYSRLSHRDVRIQVARRAQQGERLQRLVEQLADLGDRASALERRTMKMRMLFELGPPVAHPAPLEASDASGVEGALSVVGRRGSTVVAAMESRFAGIAATLDAIEGQAQGRPTDLRSTPSIFPLGGAESVLVAGFGPRRNPFTQELDSHPGIDVAAPIGTPVLAPADGVVVFSSVFDRNEGDWWRLGQVVALRHGDRFVTLFGHCDALSVRVGDRVARGQPIATVGKTGWSTTVHLHYEIRRRSPGGSWIAVDPRLFILDQSWEDEDRLLAAGWGAQPEVGAPLPRSLQR